jgi:hypothetical protein
MKPVPRVAVARIFSRRIAMPDIHRGIGQRRVLRQIDQRQAQAQRNARPIFRDVAPQPVQVDVKRPLLHLRRQYGLWSLLRLAFPAESRQQTCPQRQQRTRDEVQTLAAIQAMSP